MFKMLGAAVAAISLACAGAAQAVIIEEGPLPEPGQDGSIGPTLMFAPGAEYASMPLVFSALGDSGVRQVYFGVEMTYRHWKYEPGFQGTDYHPDWNINESPLALSCYLLGPGECHETIPMGGPTSTSFDLSVTWDGNQVTAYWKPFDDWDQCAEVYTGQICRAELIYTITSLEIGTLIGEGEKGYRFEAISPVPEPATWAMMIGGFGMLGGALRLQRTAGGDRPRRHARSRRQHV